MKQAEREPIVNTTRSTDYFAYLASLTKRKRAPLLKKMTQEELRDYAAYIFSGHEDFFQVWLNSLPNHEVTPDDVDD